MRRSLTKVEDGRSATTTAATMAERVMRGRGPCPSNTSPPPLSPAKRRRRSSCSASSSECNNNSSLRDVQPSHESAAVTATTTVCSLSTTTTPPCPVILSEEGNEAEVDPSQHVAQLEEQDQDQDQQQQELPSISIQNHSKRLHGAQQEQQQQPQKEQKEQSPPLRLPGVVSLSASNVSADDSAEVAAAPVKAAPVAANADVADATLVDDRTSKDYYFDSYSHHAIHEEMLKDEVRTRTYEMAIMQNTHLFQDKIVLDVGCGTGILSMFASRAGAKHVYAVDCSSIIDQARDIVRLNGFGEDRITLIKGKVEEITLPVPMVDIIVSEWMGYFLLYESMLETVIFARDKWLIQGGIVFPDKAIMYLSAIEDGNVKRDRLDFWDDVYGFDMTPIKEIALKEPVVDVVDAKALVTDQIPILHLDILTCTKEDLEFSSTFQLQAVRNDYIHGLVAYFECAFTQIHKPIGFSTAPFARYTHWKQTIFYLPETLTICAGEYMEGEISCKPNKRNPRDLDIGLALSFQGRHGGFQKTIQYRLR